MYVLLDILGFNMTWTLIHIHGGSVGESESEQKRIGSEEIKVFLLLSFHRLLLSIII